VFRSLTGTIGAALLGGAALLAPPQEQASTKPAGPARSATGPSLNVQECYDGYVSVVQTAGRDHDLECWRDRVGARCRTTIDDCMALAAERSTGPFSKPQ
jgi:hypothetical protein